MLLALTHVVMAQSTPTPEAPPATVEVVYQETLPFPETFDGERPFWQTNRFGQVLLVDQDGETFGVDQAGRAIRALDSEEAVKAYRFPLKYLTRWSEDWQVVRDGRSVPLPQGPDFTGAALLTRWGADRRDALLRIERSGIEVYSVSPPPSVRDYPSCFASVPESCLASGITLLKEYAGDPKAAKIARAQVGRACTDGVVRACFIGVALDGGRNGPAARSCLDGEAEACATVGGSLYAEAKLKGESSGASERMLEYACNEGVAGACTEAAQMYDERDLPHNALLMLDRACVSGDRDACEGVEARRDRAFATGIARACLRDEPDPIGCITLAQFLEEKPQDDIGIDAFGAWSNACSAGEDTACRSMAPYVDRWGVTDPRVETATTALLTTCEGGGQEACVGAAHLLSRLDAKDDRYGKARQLYVDACQAGEIQGCLSGAEQSWAGTAKRLELPGAEALYGIACEAGSAQGCAGLGKTVAADRRRTDEAVVALEKGCELQSASACTQLGILAVEGRHRPNLDPRTIFERGCDEGEAEACYRLGVALDEGDATIGETSALDAFAKGCDGGQLDACEAVGRAHLERGTPYEAGIAAAHFEAACNGGRTKACSELGTLYKTGNGVPKDPRKGRQLLVKAGELEPVKHVRLGARLGFLGILGVDTEVVLPIPVGPAISVGGDFSYLPGSDELTMTYLGPTVRIYPSHSARGLYAAAGWHQFRINAKEEVTTNAGFNGRVGVRVQKKATFGGVEIGLASVDAPRVAEIIRPIPLVVPVFGVSGGVAFF